MVRSQEVTLSYQNNNQNNNDIFGSDIYMDADFKPSILNNGELRLVTGVETILQDIRLRLITLKGTLFYDSTYGSELPLFMQDDEVDNTSISSEVARSLEADPRVEPYSVSTVIEKNMDEISIIVNFQLIGDDTPHNITLPRINFLQEG